MKMKSNLIIAVLLILQAYAVQAQDKASGVPLIGSKAPSFSAASTEGILHFPEDFGRSWKILFSHPRDFTAVCTSEVLELAHMQEEFESLGVKFAIVSNDDVVTHEKWKESIESIMKPEDKAAGIRFPLVADTQREISSLYGMIHQESRDVRYVRGVFIIDPGNIIQAISFYPMQVGRNLEEVIRTVQALQTADAHGSTPVNWKPGDDLLLPASPYLNPAVKADSLLTEQYYNLGGILWYKKQAQ